MPRKYTSQSTPQWQGVSLGGNERNLQEWEIARKELLIWVYVDCI